MKNENIKRIEQLTLLSNSLYNEYTKELFINDDEKHKKLCIEVIIHEADEKYGIDDMQDVEAYLVKNMVKDKYKFLN